MKKQWNSNEEALKKHWDSQEVLAQPRAGLTSVASFALIVAIHLLISASAIANVMSAVLAPVRLETGFLRVVGAQKERAIEPTQARND